MDQVRDIDLNQDKAHDIDRGLNLNRDLNSTPNPDLPQLVRVERSQRSLKITFANNKLLPTPDAIMEVYKHLL